MNEDNAMYSYFCIHMFKDPDPADHLLSRPCRSDLLWTPGESRVGWRGPCEFGMRHYKHPTPTTRTCCNIYVKLCTAKCNVDATEAEIDETPYR